MGRLLYFVLNIFASNGYHIKFFSNIDIRKLEKDLPYIGLVESIENLVVVDDVPVDTRTVIYLFDKKDTQYSHLKWKRLVQIRFDIFASYVWSAVKGARPIFLPYPMHPLHYKKDLSLRLEKARNESKKMRIFFSGDTDGYKRNRISYPTRKLTRKEVIDTISDKLLDKTIRVSSPQHYNALVRGTYTNKCVLVDNKKYRIESAEWLEALARSDFFLCAPGYVMPMCHNVIETMAVGTIPILNYPEWLNPSLKDGVNCIEFDDSTSLVENILRVLSMKREKLTELREKVIEYYDNNLDPVRFVEKFEANEESETKILMITDAAIAKNAAKLNKNSILINGSPRTPKDILTGICQALRL